MEDRDINLQLRGESFTFQESLLPSIIADRNLLAAYVVNPKSGCTTIKNLLFALDRGFVFHNPENIHKSYFAFYRFNRSKCEDEDRHRFNTCSAFTFSVVRHPLQRFVSAFIDKVIGEDLEHYFDGRDFVNCYLGIDIGGDPVKAALEYLAWLERGESLKNEACQRRDPHFRPQVENLAVNKKLPIDFIGKIENLAETVTKLESVFGRSVTLPPNPHFRKRDHVSKRLLLESPEIEKAVKRFYKPDFDAFDYN